MANVLIGAPNFSDLSSSAQPNLFTPALSGGSWEAGNPLANLQSRKLHLVARSSGVTEIQTRLHVDLGTDRPVRVIAIPKHTVSSAGQYRVTGRSSASLFAYTAGEDLSVRGAVFARTGIATFVDRSGTIRTAADGVARDGHWINGERTLLLEPQRTNLCIRSEEFDTWALSNVTTVTANAITAPDGTTTADLLANAVPTANSSANRVVTFTADGEKCAALYLKAGTAAVTDFGVRDETAAVWRHLARATWTAGVPTLSTIQGSGTLYPVEALRDGWYRVLISVPGAVAANTHRLYVYPSGTASVAGTVYAWGAQAEDAVVPSSYIKTEGTTVTRNADSLYFPFTAPPQAMTVYVRGRERGTRLEPGAYIWQVSQSNNNPRVHLNRTVGTARMQHQTVNTAGTFSTTNAPLAGDSSVGDLVEYRSLLASNGNVSLATTLNSGTEQVGSPVTGTALESAWSGQRLWIGTNGSTNAGLFAFTHVVVAAGEQSLATMRTAQYDSGWRDAWPAGATLETLAGLNCAALAVVPATAPTLRHFSVQISDPSNPAGFIDLARLVVSGGYQPTFNFSVGATVTTESETTRTVTDGGAAIYDTRPLRRIARFAIDNLEANEAWLSAWRVMKRLGASNQCFLVLDPDADANTMAETAFLCVPRELSVLEYTAAMFRSLGFAFTEEL
jgi:hypothetical protein